MNDHEATDATPELPELSQASIDRIEHEVFASMAAGRTAEPRSADAIASTAASRRRARRRGWLTGIGVAAAFVAGVLITPQLLSLSTTSTAGGDMTSFTSDSPAGGAVDTVEPETTTDAVSGAATESAVREIIASATATVRVDDIAGAVNAVSALAVQHHGYVESTDISAAARTTDASDPSQNGEYGWVSIRVPSADLTTVIQELADTGTVIASSTSQQDVTSAAIDLRARVDATQASVDRLTELMSQSGSVSELIDAEVELTDRQAQLESYTQQLAALEDQVAMSSLQVQLTKQATASSAEPDGFADGLLAGWNGLIVSLNALVIAVGFMLPWLVVVGGVVLAIWLVRRRRRIRRAAENP